MKIFFIRHGETTGDVENRYGGNYDDHLTEKGKAQSNEVAELLKNKGVEIIFSSPLIRAQETSKIISERIVCNVKVETDLKERNQYGILTGMEKIEAKEKYPEMVELLKDKMNTIQGAESYEDFSKRIINSLNYLMDNNSYKVIAIVSHGGPLRVVFRNILKLGELDEIGDCSFVEFDKCQDGTFSLIKTNGLKPDFKSNIE